MNDNSAQNFFDILKTKQRVNSFIRLYDVLDGFTHHVGNIDMKGILSSVYGNNVPNWVEKINMYAPGFDLGKLDDSNMGVLKSVKDLIDKSVAVKIELPFEPSLSFVDEVIKKLKGNYDSMNFIIDIDVKESSEPGAMFYIKGKIIDLTIRKRVISYLSSQDVINRYL
jgi:hypothetical protein